ncbi:SEC-C domain-containing protein [Alkalibaculum sp. M08DMB]|uniref:SEC-C domain-containing protein n=1 Tax=Alkalibaculum sporogenes TaxID=2655001 RepID=A0A6A7K781_9FIRM|nr:SEC-C metal-binding domain-containing protein [Alkalibaculum sporogenes]MPW24983.1 SEC-C domain-containing protein [Alkalibaculum sporogenes]
MSCYSQWKKIIENESVNEEKQYEFWNNFCDQEKAIYKKILEEKSSVVQGSVKELAEKYDISVEYFMGFLDGINDSISESLQLEIIEEETEIKLEINFEELYKNMLAVPADWLFNLEEWSNIFTDDERKRLRKDFNRAKIVVNENKVGRNDQCPCGSGKKYKKCCALA